MSNEDRYWQTIDEAREGAEDAYEVAERLQALLVQRTPEEVYAFVEQQTALMARSYSWELWGAAYIINGGCSDDGFEYFRGWLLAQGREVFEAALTAPDSLADVAEEDDLEAEDVIAAAAVAYKELTGDYPKGVVVNYPDLGESWDFDDEAEMKPRYPRLWAAFCED